MEEKMLKYYINYLYKFGLLNEENISNYFVSYQRINDYLQKQSKMNNLTNSQINIKNKIINTLIDFLQNLSDDSKISISTSIFNSFIENRNDEIKYRYTKISKIYKKLLINSKYLKWKKISKMQTINSFLSSSFNNSLTSPNLQKLSNINTTNYINNSNDNSNRHNIVRNNSNKKLVTSLSKSNYNTKMNINTGFKEFNKNMKYNYSNKEMIFSTINTNKTEKYPMETSKFLKEQEELSHCTFKPNIQETLNYYNNVTKFNTINTTNVNSVHNRLYTDSKKYRDRRELKQLEKLNNDAKLATFRPQLISKSPKTLHYSNFHERLKSFEVKKNHDIQKLKDESENIYAENCSFSPNININNANNSICNNNNTNNKSINNNINKSLNKNFSQISLIKHSCSNEKLPVNKQNVPVYERLYEYNKIQKQNYIKKQQDIENAIKLNSSPSMRSIINNQNFSGNNQALNYNNIVQPSVDYKKIEELYNDYKKVKNRINQKRTDLDIERGYTFKPELCVNDKYFDKINSNFMERETQFLINRRKFIDYYNYENEEHLNGQKWGYGKYSNKQKEEIANNIIERLYKKGLEKFVEKNGVNININKSPHHKNDCNLKKKHKNHINSVDICVDGDNSEINNNNNNDEINNYVHDNIQNRKNNNLYNNIKMSENININNYNYNNISINQNSFPDSHLPNAYNDKNVGNIIITNTNNI